MRKPVFLFLFLFVHTRTYRHIYNIQELVGCQCVQQGLRFTLAYASSTLENMSIAFIDDDVKGLAASIYTSLEPKMNALFSSIEDDRDASSSGLINDDDMLRSAPIFHGRLL